jgi:hypothetical protein
VIAKCGVWRRRLPGRHPVGCRISPAPCRLRECAPP